MKNFKSKIAVVLSVGMLFSSITPIFADEPKILSVDNTVLETMSETYNKGKLPNRELTINELRAWIKDYEEQGGANEFELEVVRLINIERAKKNLSPLVIDESLMKAARFKTQEMSDLDYHVHNSPVYGYADPLPVYDFSTPLIERIYNVDSNGGEYYWWNEGLVWRDTSTDPETVVKVLTSLAVGHSLLGKDSETIGVGFVKNLDGGGFFWTAQVGTPKHRVTATKSKITLPDRKLTDDELNEWIHDYQNQGGANEFELEVVRLLNIERAKENLLPVIISEPFMKSARFKSQEMSDLDYFEHESPVYGKFTGIPNLFNGWYENINFVSGENIALGQINPEMVIDSWMNSPGHRANMLDKNKKLIGIGFYNSYWTMQLGNVL